MAEDKSARAIGMSSCRRRSTMALALRSLCDAALPEDHHAQLNKAATRRLSPGPTPRPKAARPSPAGEGAITVTSLQRLDLDQSVVVVGADPERHRRGAVVDRHRSHIGVGRHQKLCRRAGLRIDAHDAVGRHGGGPQVAVFVERGAIGIGVGRQIVFGEFIGLGIEHGGLVAAIFGHRDAIPVVDLHAAQPRMRGGRRVPGHLQRLGVDLAEMAVVELRHP